MRLLPAAQEKVTFVVPVIKAWVLGMRRVHWQRALESQICCCCQVLGGKEDRRVLSSTTAAAESTPTSHSAVAATVSMALTPAKGQQCWSPHNCLLYQQGGQGLCKKQEPHMRKTGCWWAFSCFSEGNVCKVPLGKSATGAASSLEHLALQSPRLLHCSPLTAGVRGWFTDVAQEGLIQQYTVGCWLHHYPSRFFIYLGTTR